MEIDSILRKVEVVDEGGTLGDPTMESLNIGDSSTGHSTQPAMSGNTRKLATSLVEMKIASGDLSMPKAEASQGEDGQQPPGDATDSLNVDPPPIDPLGREDSHEDPMNVDDLPTSLTADVGEEADSAEDCPLDAKGQLEVPEEAPLIGEGHAQQEQSNPSSRDLPMTEVREEAPLTKEGVSQEEQCNPTSRDLPMTDARLVDPVDSMITEEPFHQSPLRVTIVVPFIPPPATTQPEETPQSTLEPTRMNVDIVDDTMRDLDPFSPTPKALVLCPQPLVVREIIDLDLVHRDNTFDDWDSVPNEPELNVDLDLVPQLGKEKKQLPRSHDASFDVGTASAPPDTQSKDKEGPSTARRGREGTGRKDKERATLA